MLSVRNKEVKESLKKNEEKLTLRFNTCLILMNNIEDVVMSANKTWMNIYYLHKPSDFPIQINGKDEEEEKDEEKEKEFEKINLDKEEEQEATKEGLPEI